MMKASLIPAAQPSHAHHGRWWRHVDQLGTMASFLCAVHCLALPLVWTVLPLLGLSFLGDPTIERAFVGFASLLALISLGRGYRLHRRAGALLLAVVGIGLLALGVSWGEHLPLLWHSLLEASGGSLIALGHYLNLRWLKVLTEPAIRDVPMLTGGS